MIIIATTSPTIGLHITPASDVEKRVLDWRTEIAGDGQDSNMMKIDKAFSDIDGVIGDKADLVDNHLKVEQLPLNALTWSSGQASETPEITPESLGAISIDKIGAPNGIVPTDERGRAKLENLPYPWEMNGISFITEGNVIFEKLLSDMASYKAGTITADNFTALITVERLNDSQLDFRRTDAGYTYTNDTQAKKQGAVRLLKLADDAWESYAVNGKLILTWQQVQYALINNALVAPADAGEYAWMPHMASVVRNVTFDTQDGATKGAEFGAEARNVRLEDGKTLSETIGDFLKLDSSGKVPFANMPYSSGVFSAHTYTPEGGTTGIDYEISIPGLGDSISEANIGTYLFLVRVHATSQSIRPYFNVKQMSTTTKFTLRRGLSNDVNSLVDGASDTWLKISSLILVSFQAFTDFKGFKVINVVKPCADDLYGPVLPTNAGLGRDISTEPVGLYPTTNGAEPFVLKTPEQVREDISAVNRAGDTLTGPLTAPKLVANTLDVELALNVLAAKIGAGEPITDVPTLMAAVAKLNTNPFALVGLTFDMVNNSPLYLRAGFDGAAYTNLEQFKRDIILASASPRPVKSYNDVQYFLIHGVAPAISGIANAESTYYWWKEGGQPIATVLSPGINAVNAYTLSDAAFRFSFNGNPVAFDNLNADTAKGFRLSKSVPSSVVATDTWYADAEIPTLKSKVIDVMKLALEASENKYVYPWMSMYQIQYYILTGNYLSSDSPELPSDEVYWWRRYDKDPVQFPPTNDLLSDMLAFAKSEITDSAFNSLITPERANVFLHFSRTANAYNTFNALQLTTPKTRLRTLSSETYAVSEATLLALTWYQLQDYILTGVLASAEEAKQKGYNWEPYWLNKEAA